jgi:hypothetical protein
MTEGEYQQTIKELDLLLKDPVAPLDAVNIWSLLANRATHTAKFSKRLAMRPSRCDVQSARVDRQPSRRWENRRRVPDSTMPNANAAEFAVIELLNAHGQLPVGFERASCDLASLRTGDAGFRSLTEHIDTTTPAGRMMMQMVGAFAEFERAMRVVGQLEVRADANPRPGLNDVHDTGAHPMIRLRLRPSTYRIVTLSE